MLATLLVEPCVVSLRRGLLTRELKEDLNKKLLHEHGAQALDEEAAALSLFVRRRLGSRPDSLALIDDVGAIGRIDEACRRKSVHNDGRTAILGCGTPRHQAQRPRMRRAVDNHGVRDCWLPASVPGKWKSVDSLF